MPPYSKQSDSVRSRPKRKPSKKPVHDDPMSSDESDCERGENKLLLRRWLLAQLESGTVPGLSWADKDEDLIKISWTHGSRQEFDATKDCNLFRKWAIHTGRYKEGSTDEDPKRWKANFRCAMNSLPDVVEVKDMSVTKGNKAFKVYRFLKEQPRKSVLRKIAMNGGAQKTTSTKAMKKETLKKLRKFIEQDHRRQLNNTHANSPSPTPCTKAPVTTLRRAPLTTSSASVKTIYSPSTDLPVEPARVPQPTVSADHMTPAIRPRSLVMESRVRAPVPKISIPIPSIKTLTINHRNNSSNKTESFSNDHVYATGISVHLPSSSPDIPTFVEEDRETEVPFYPRSSSFSSGSDGEGATSPTSSSCSSGGPEPMSDEDLANMVHTWEAEAGSTYTGMITDEEELEKKVYFHRQHSETLTSLNSSESVYTISVDVLPQSEVDLYDDNSDTIYSQSSMHSPHMVTREVTLDEM